MEQYQTVSFVNIVEKERGLENNIKEKMSEILPKLNISNHRFKRLKKSQGK